MSGSILTLVSVLVCFSAVPGFCASTATEGKCKCIPDQWEGMLLSTDREYDLQHRKSGKADTKLYIHYDYTNKRFAMVDLSTGNKAIADYAQGIKYIVRGDWCQALSTAEPMRRMCLPDEAELLGEYSIGDSLPVSMWQFDGPYNESMKTTVVQTNCLPLAEEVTMTRGDFTSVSSSMYLDVTMGIKDEQAFAPPTGCKMDPHRQRFNRNHEKSNHVKRKADPNHLLHAIRNRLYIFH